MLIIKQPFRLEADNFVHPANYYLLSHFHEDHMRGLKRKFKKGGIICSPITAKLLAYRFYIPEKHMLTMESDETREIQGVRITALDANHCPGALLFIVETEYEKNVYTGDFRYNSAMAERAHLFRNVDTLFFDNTYEGTKATLPTQEHAIERVLRAIEANPDKTVIIALYTLGKNKIIRAVYKRLGKKVYVPKDKAIYFELVGDGACITTEKDETNVYGYSRYYLERYHRAKGEELILMTTGFSNVPAYQRMFPNFEYIPYSEHSSYEELTAFIEMVRARRMVRMLEDGEAVF